MIDHSWTSALSLTLLHTLWQAMFITTLAWLVNRLLRDARHRYAVSVSALMLILISSLSTLILYIGESQTVAYSLRNAIPSYDATTTQRSIYAIVGTFVHQHQTWIALAYAVGVALFSARLIVSAGYLKFVRRQAVRLESWQGKLDELVKQWHVKKLVTVAESLYVRTPVVAGYLKPMILLPAGLISGFTSEQIELILLHELAHIRRHDYLINALQVFAETILFFNPLVWMISANIRHEREQCCDDLVMNQGYSASLYARTLLQIAESQVHSPSALALAITGNKNELLNRIKRMMEHNSKTATRAKFLPIALIVLGLVFASWLSIDKNENRGDESTSAADTIPADTTIEKESSASYSKRTIIRYDEEGEPHEETVEEFSGDEDMREALENQMNLSVPDAPDFPNFPNFPDAPEWPDMTGMQPLLFNFHLDSMHDGSWGNFTNEFRENLSEQMSQFRQLQSRQLDEQMQRMEKELSRMERALDEMPLITEEQMQRMQADINGKMQRIPNDFMEENYW